MISDQNLVAEFDLAEVARKEAEEKWTLIQACMDIDDARSESNDWFSVSGAQPKLVKSELATLARVFGLHVKRSKGKGVPLLTDYQRAIRELQLNRVMFENRVETLYNEWLNTIGTTDESMNNIGIKMTSRIIPEDIYDPRKRHRITTHGFVAAVLWIIPKRSQCIKNITYCQYL